MDELLIYGVVGDEWAGLDAATVVPMINAGSGDLSIRINSPGGFIIEGLAIYNAITRAQSAGRKVTCHIDGLAASMASVLAMAGDDIIMADNALLMIHNPWDSACGDAEDLRNAADQLDRMKAQLVAIYARRTGMAADDISTMMDAETWLNAQEALDQGFVTAIGAAGSASACNISKFGFRKAPKHSAIAKMAMASTPKAAPPVQPKGKSMTEEEMAVAAAATAQAEADAAAAAANAARNTAVNLTTADVAAAVSAERTRVSQIRALGTRHRIEADTVEKLIAEGTSLAQARETMLDQLASRADSDNVGQPGGNITITADARDKWMQGATNWLITRSGQASVLKKAAQARGEKIDLDPGEFAGVNLVDLAKESLQHTGARNIGRNPEAIIGAAFTARNEISQGAGDFPLLLENTMHKVLQAAYQITPDTWSRFCGKGTVTDFRPSNRYLRGTFSSLDSLSELGEFHQKSIPDGEKQQISASTKGNIIALSRQAIINDDMGAFITLAGDLGRAAKLTIEKDVYALLASNPVMYDGQPLFSNAHRNIAGGTWTMPGGGAAPAASFIGVAAFDAARVAMASQLDPSGNEILDVRPETLLLPLVDEGTGRVIIGSPFDPDATSKLQRPNMVQGLVGDIVGSARLSTGTSGHGWYFFADKEMAPAIEVVFLNGVEEPFLDNSLGWRVDGTEFKVRLDYGTGATNWRSAFYNPAQ